MLLLRNFNRQATVIRLQQFGTPKIAPFNELELPVGSIFHYVPMSGASEIGPPQTMPMFEHSAKLVQVKHVANLTDDGIVGRPRRIEKEITRDVMQYHRINKKLRRCHNEKIVERDPKVLFTVNYAPLELKYKYPQTILSWYERICNNFTTVMAELEKCVGKYDRQNYIYVPCPDFVPARAKFIKAQERRDLTSIGPFSHPTNVFFLELWTWLGEARKSSIFNRFDQAQLRKINVLIQYNDKFINLNLGELDFWRQGEMGGKVSPDQMQRRFYRSVITLMEAAAVIDEGVVTEEEDPTVAIDRSDAEEDLDADLDVAEEIEKFDAVAEEVDSDEDFEIVKQSDDAEDENSFDAVVTIDDGVEFACNRYIEAGTLSTKEYKKVLDKSETYKTIANPFGEGTLSDMLEVTPEEVQVEEEVLFDDITVFDKNMTKTTMKKFNKDYIANVLPKDIVSSVVSVQRAGYIVDDYNVDKVIDAANRLQVHTLRLVPVKGSPSTIRFTTPLLDEDGYWVANDVKYTMRKQRVDVPIRKTADDTVALTTFYGKNFVMRSQKQSANYTDWLGNQIVTLGKSDQNQKVTGLKLSNVFDPAVKVPKDYSTIAKRVSSMTIGSAVYSFDVKKIDTFFTESEVKDLKKQSLTPIGRSRNALFGMDDMSVIYKVNDKGLEEMGRMEEILGLDTEKSPKEYTELSMMGKAVPLALIFCYYLGIEKALKEFNVSYRVTEAGERVGKDEGDMIIPLKGNKLVLTFDRAEQELIFRGFKSYLSIMKDFTLRDFNNKDVYLNLIQKDGLSIRYLNELDLMETMYVDPISERLLKRMKEPTHFKGLLKRANEMVTHDQHKEETDLDEMHIYGHQRIAGAIYTGIVRGVRDANNKPGGKKKIDIPSSAIWSYIAQDPAVMPASDATPMQSVKEGDVVTSGGNGGRSRRSMVKRTRKFTASDLGTISGDTVDSGDVGITAHSVANPIFATMDGVIDTDKRNELGVYNLISSCAALAPGALYDDPKRINFISIQHGSGMAADGYVAPSFRTGYEKVIAHRCSSTQAVISDHDGKVVAVDEFAITVEYDTKPKTTKSYPLGKTFGKHEGAVFPHELVANYKKGAKFTKGSVLSYNRKFFEPDIFNPNQVNWKLGVYANVVLLEGVDTLEDSSALSPWLSEQLRTQTTKVKNITLRFDQAVHELVSVGAKLNPDDNLCLIEEATTAGNKGFSGDSIETLKALSSQSPKAGAECTIDKIEVFYNGDFEDMSESILEVVKKGDRRRKKEAKSSPIELAETGKIDSTLRIDGNPVELDTVVVRVYMTQNVAAIGGDKAVFANQMKTTFRRIMTGVNETATGIPLHAIFGKKSIDDRIVLSVYQIGTTSMICEILSQKCSEMRWQKAA